MQIEAFTEAKDPARPDANEDRLVILPGRAYAVIDGVSARAPDRHDGMLSGQYAAMLLQRALEADPPVDGAAVVADLTEVIGADYARRGVLERMRTENNPRFAATLALVIQRPAGIEIVLAGDSGVRINGTVIHQDIKDLDGITAALRVAAWRRAPGDPANRERLARLVTLNGTRNAPEWDQAALAAIGAEARAACRTRYPAIPPALIDALLQGGILNAQRDHQNAAASPLGYACLDGFPVPDTLVTRVLLDTAAVDTIELFTDGYFAPAAGFGVSAWEARFAEIEAEDPTKTGRYASVKGSLGTLRADDRTYLGVRLR